MSSARPQKAVPYMEIGDLAMATNPLQPDKTHAILLALVHLSDVEVGRLANHFPAEVYAVTAWRMCDGYILPSAIQTGLDMAQAMNPDLDWPRD